MDISEKSKRLNAARLRHAKATRELSEAMHEYNKALETQEKALLVEIAEKINRDCFEVSVGSDTVYVKTMSPRGVVFKCWVEIGAVKLFGYHGEASHVIHIRPEGDVDKYLEALSHFHSLMNMDGV